MPSWETIGELSCVDWLWTPHINYSQTITNFNILYLGKKVMEIKTQLVCTSFIYMLTIRKKKITNLNLHTLVIICTMFCNKWFSGFRGEDFWKSLMDEQTDDGRKVMAIAHLRVRWAKKGNEIIRIHRYYKNKLYNNSIKHH